MSRIALDHLREQLPNDTGDKSQPWEWYLRIREERPELLAPYLIEPLRESMSSNYYVLRADPQDATSATLEQREFVRGRDEQRLPWFKVPGNNSGDAGPVIKRNANAGPKPSVTKQTFKRFKEQARSGMLWAQYFAQATEVFERKTLHFKGEVFDTGANALDTAINVIPESNATCFLSFADDVGQLPGERREYSEYLQTMIPRYKYVTKEAQPVDGKPCALCSTIDELYPNALRAAGLNLTNVDRDGVFTGLDSQVAWKKFALCSACADLLYIFSYHLQGWFLGRVAGGKALLVPYTSVVYEKRLLFVRRTRTYIETVSKGDPIVRQEKRLQDLAEEDTIASITIVWADFGQELGDVRGMVTDVLPSRLRDISKIVKVVNEDRGTPFPELEYEGQLRLDVAFNYLGQLLTRPGGKRTEKANKGPRLFDLKRDMAAAAYHGRQLSEQRFWEEVRDISEAYLIDALERGSSYGLLNEGRTNKGDTYLTMAGWARHLCRFVYFLRTLGVFPAMNEWRYTPHNERLREEFGNIFADRDGRTGLNKEAKVFAFLLGALFGRLMWEQYKRDVNVGANALPWLKRFNLTGDDLPDLFVKVRGKLITYGTEYIPNVRDVIEELGYLGTALGTDINLSKTETGYFLLLGQSLSRTIMPSGGRDKGNTDGEDTA